MRFVYEATDSYVSSVTARISLSGSLAGFRL